MHVKGFAHIAVQAKDYQGTIDFYIKALGFKKGHEWSLPSFRIKEASMLISPDRRTCIEVFDHGAEIPAQGKKARTEEEIAHGALLHIAFYVDDAEEMYKRAIAYGAKPCIPPDELTLGEPPLTVKNSLVYSPNGEVIEFINDTDFDVLGKERA